MRALLLTATTTLLISLPLAEVQGQDSDSGSVVKEAVPNPHHLAADDVQRLLVTPACLESASAADAWALVRELPVSSKGITLSAKLYVPEGKGPWPVVILVPGGFNEAELIVAAPRHKAPRLARCGFAAVVYYKRGTGPSGGSYAQATYDDFIDDVGSIARELAQDPEIDPHRIGVSGGSNGGLIASIAAARYAEISFAINTSGPIVSSAEEGDFNIAYALRSRGYADSLVEAVLPLWKRHHAAWAVSDTVELESIAAEIRAKRTLYDVLLLPTPYDEVFADSGLMFLWPEFRSASRDYLVELKSMRKKWLSVYGEKDPIVPVSACVRNIDTLMKRSSNDDYSVIVLPGVDHSFVDADSRMQMPVIHIMINWLIENVKAE